MMTMIMCILKVNMCDFDDNANLEDHYSEILKDNDTTIVNFGNHYNDNDGNDYAGSCGVMEELG